jgi:hypothetical protein
MDRLVGERRAVATLVLALFGVFFLLMAMILFLQPPGERAVQPMLFGLATVYLTGMFALAAGYFWARWYTVGLTFSGLATAVLAMFQLGELHPIFLIWGGTHGLALLALVGRGPTALFDGRKDWRERYRMTDDAANRLGKAITRAGASLPYLVQVGLAPRQGMALIALGLGVTGVWALIRMRTWGVLALGGAAVALFLGHHAHLRVTEYSVGIAPWIGAAMLVFAIAPFARPIARRLALT